MGPDDIRWFFFLAAFLNHFNLEQNESGAFATAQVKIPDLAITDPIGKDFGRGGLGLDEFSLLGGELKVSASGKLEENSLTDLFLELNASNLALDLFGHEANASKIFLLFCPPNQSTCSTGKPRPMQMPIFRNGAGFLAQRLACGSRKTIRVERPVEQSLDEGDLPKMEVSTSACLCLILAWEIWLQGGASLPGSMIGRKKEFFYDKISYEDDLFFLNEGSVSILFPERSTRFLLTVPPSDATFEEIAFVNCTSPV